MLGLEQSLVCSKEVDTDPDSQKIRSLSNVDLEKNAKDQLLDKVTNEEVFMRVSKDRQILNSL